MRNKFPIERLGVGFEGTFGVFVQMRDVAALVRAHGFGADAVAHRLLLAVDGMEGSVRVLLPVNFITVDLKEQEAQSAKGRGR